MPRQKASFQLLKIVSVLTRILSQKHNGGPLNKNLIFLKLKLAAHFKKHMFCLVKILKNIK